MVHAFFVALGVSFTSVFTAELGDKTQLFTFLLGTHFSNRKWLLLLSVFTGMGLVTLIGYGIAVLFQTFIDTTILQIVGGSIFILIGTITLFYINAVRSRVQSVRTERGNPVIAGSQRTRVRGVWDGLPGLPRWIGKTG